MHMFCILLHILFSSVLFPTCILICDDPEIGFGSGFDKKKKNSGSEYWVWNIKINIKMISLQNVAETCVEGSLYDKPTYLVKLFSFFLFFMCWAILFLFHGIFAYYIHSENFPTYKEVPGIHPLIFCKIAVRTNWLLQIYAQPWHEYGHI